MEDHTAGTLNQTRTHNAVNALLNLSTTGGGAWANPTYDAAGNMTIAPKPGDESTPLHLKYDAWNRLVRVTYDNDVPLAEYRLDGLGRRIAKLVRKVAGEERPCGTGRIITTTKPGNAWKSGTSLRSLRRSQRQWPPTSTASTFGTSVTSTPRSAAGEIQHSTDTARAVASPQAVTQAPRHSNCDKGGNRDWAFGIRPDAERRIPNPAVIHV